jgi:hypothetical protein
VQLFFVILPTIFIGIYSAVWDRKIEYNYEALGLYVLADFFTYAYNLLAYVGLVFIYAKRRSWVAVFDRTPLMHTFGISVQSQTPPQDIEIAAMGPTQSQGIAATQGTLYETSGHISAPTPIRNPVYKPPL